MLCSVLLECAHLSLLSRWLGRRVGVHLPVAIARRLIRKESLVLCSEVGSLLSYEMLGRSDRGLLGLVDGHPGEGRSIHPKSASIHPCIQAIEDVAGIEDDVAHRSPVLSRRLTGGSRRLPRLLRPGRAWSTGWQQLRSSSCDFSLIFAIEDEE